MYLVIRRPNLKKEELENSLFGPVLFAGIHKIEKDILYSIGPFANM